MTNHVLDPVNSPPITSVGAGDFVGERFGQADEWGNKAFTLATQMITQLQNFNVEPASAPGPDLSQGYEISVTPPEAPEIPDASEFETNIYRSDIPSFNLPFPYMNAPEPIIDPPEDVGSAPIMQFSDKPVMTDPTPPGDMPDLIDVDAYIPTAPNIEFPELPDLIELDIPEPPNIVEHEWTAERPEITFDVPDLHFDYQVEGYSSELLDQVQSRISKMLEGGTGLPAPIEQAIFDRSRSREDAEADRRIMEAVDEWASRGFSLPSGIVDKRIMQVRQENQNQNNTHNREVTIYVHEQELQNLRFAVQQGIALEQIMTQLYISEQQLKFQVAQTVVDIAVQTFRAQIEMYNAEVQAYSAEAQVYETLIRGELSKVEAYRSEIEAERVRGEINQQKVEVYRSRLEGLNTLMRVYATQMQAAQVAAQVNEARVGVFASEIEAFRSQIQANADKFSAWATEIQAESTKMQGYEAEVRAFTARTSAYATSLEAESIVPRFRLEANQTAAQAFQAEVSGFQSYLDAERTRIQSKASAYQAQSSVFGGQTQLYSVDGEIAGNQQRINMEQSRANADLQISHNQMKIQEAAQLSGQLVQALQGASQAASQLAASSMSAVNASASISEGASASNSWSNAYNYSQQESTSTQDITSDNTNRNISSFE